MPEVAEHEKPAEEWSTPPKRIKLDVDADDTTSEASATVSWEVEDPSEFRPEQLGNMGKEQAQFRVFYNEDDPRYPIIKKTYTDMNKLQTVESATGRLTKWSKLNKCKMPIMEALMKLDNIVDESDPDTSLPNSYHCFQTAERIREAYPSPDMDWFHLTGLIHDIGKILAFWGEPQYAVVGDTFPVGCAFSKKCVFYELFDANPDHHDPKYNTKHGMYKPNCGLKDIVMSFGHDEYLYQVLVGNKCKLPEEALYIVRYHSFYPWHTGGDYDHLCDDKDRKMMSWVRKFNKFDLYSKADKEPDIPKLKEYYQQLIDKYIPGDICW